MNIRKKAAVIAKDILLITLFIVIGTCISVATKLTIYHFIGNPDRTKIIEKNVCENVKVVERKVYVPMDDNSVIEDDDLIPFHLCTFIYEDLPFLDTEPSHDGYICEPPVSSEDNEMTQICM